MKVISNNQFLFDRTHQEIIQLSTKNILHPQIMGGTHCQTRPLTSIVQKRTDESMIEKDTHDYNNNLKNNRQIKEKQKNLKTFIILYVNK